MGAEYDEPVPVELSDRQSDRKAAVLRHELLERLHHLLAPRTYFEIGVSRGLSLTLSRTRTVAVDPFFDIRREIQCDLHLVRTSSDEFFARRQPFAHLDEPLVDLAFIDGMHLAEYALRDLLNTERYTHPGTVIVMDDMLPRNQKEANRRHPGTSGGAWAGDVYKVVQTLRTLRPDWVCLEMDTQPTGTIVLLNPDAGSDVLPTAYDDLVSEYVTPDPQDVPDDVLTRRTALDPAAFLATPLWEDLRGVRDLPRGEAQSRVARLLRDHGLAPRSVTTAATR